jgi:hypothetical protein
MASIDIPASTGWHALNSSFMRQVFFGFRAGGNLLHCLPSDD